MVTWQFLQGAVLRGTHEHSSPDLCERAEWFFFHRISHHYSILFLQECNAIATTSLPSSSASQHLSLPCWKWPFHFFLSHIAPIFSGCPWSPPWSHSQAVVVVGGCIISSSSSWKTLPEWITLPSYYCSYKQAKTCRSRGNFHFVPHIVSLPLASRAEVFFSSASSAWIQNTLSEVVTKTVWIQVTAKDLYYLQLSIF